MSWRECATSGCRRRIREGLRKYGLSADGVPLADGRYCVHCRRRQADPADRPLKPGNRVTVIGGELRGLTGVFVGWDTVLFSGERVPRDTNLARIAVGPAEFSVRKWDLRRAVRL